MNRIIITGANGFIAKSLIKRLSSKNHYIYALTSSSIESTTWMKGMNNVEVIQADLSEYHQLTEKIPGNCDLLINFAWRETRGNERDNVQLQESNVRHSIDLLESARKLGCKRVVQIGSFSVYGKQDGRITELSNCIPVTEYAKAKLNCYSEMKAYCEKHELHFVELRLGSVYGETMPENNLLTKVINCLLNDKKCVLTTSCEQKWEYINVKDVVGLLVQLIEEKKPEGVYNISSSDTRMLKDFIHVIETKMGKSGNAIYGVLTDGLGCQSIFCDNSKMKNTFDCGELVPFEAGIDLLIKSMKKTNCN